MPVFASPRGSQNDQTCIQKQFVIQVPFQLRKNTLPASILLQLGSLLGLPRHPQEASKASLKPLLEASWAKLEPSSIFCLPGGTPGPTFSQSFYKILNIFSTPQRHNRVPWIALLSGVSLLLQPLFCTLALLLVWTFKFSTSQSGSMDCPCEALLASATCKPAHCRGGLGEAPLNLLSKAFGAWVWAS